MSRINWPTIPTSWREVALSSVAKIIMGQSPPGSSCNQENRGLPFFQGKTDFGELSPVPVSWCTKPSRIAEPGDILISVRAPVGPTNIANEKSCIGRGLAAIRPNPEVINRDYLLYYIRFAEDALASLGQGSTFEAINKNDLYGLRVALPPLPEQQRIVEILKQADALRRQRQEIFDQAKQLPAALFLEMFGDPRDYPKRWGAKPFGSFVTYSKYGPRFPNREYSEVGARILRTTDMVLDGSLRWWKSPIMPITKEELNQHALKAGTLLVSRSGTIGPVALFSGADEPCIAGAYLIEFGLSDRINHRYVTDFLLTQYGQALLTGGSQSMTQANLNAPTIKKIPIPIPPRELQDRYERISSDMRRYISTQEEEAQDLSLLSEELARSGFTGDLTESWRETHREELESWLGQHAEQFVKRPSRIEITVTAPTERKPPGRPARRWLLDQLSEVQSNVYLVLQEWKGTLIPSEDLDNFLAEWPIQHLEDAHDQVRRALDQLAGLGLIAKVSLPNDVGEYVTGYRVLREEELSKADDLERLGAPT